MTKWPPEMIVHIVDEDEAMRDSLRLLFSVRGAKTAVYDSLREFRGTWDPAWPGCLVVSLSGPAHDALSYLRMVTEASPRLSAVVLSGDVASGLRDRVLDAGAHTFVESPFDPARLVSLVRNALDGAS